MSCQSCPGDRIHPAERPEASARGLEASQAQVCRVRPLAIFDTVQLAGYDPSGTPTVRFIFNDEAVVTGPAATDAVGFGSEELHLNSYTSVAQ